jgi:hypothetical protein
MSRIVSASAQAPRDPAHKLTDLAALQAIAQAAVDVELFTIPLYMTSLYSITGRHEINSQNSTLYKGRIWPGAAPVAKPSNANEIAFNILFSIFVEEMLHLQMAGNMATAVGVAPSFTSTALQTASHGWHCYGPDQTTIPRIIDLKDTTNEDVRVNVGPLDGPRVELFLAIEQPKEVAEAAIKPDRRKDYFPKAPFANWTPQQPLPMFGTIAWMYQCYFDYLHVTYSDGTTLWEAAFNPASIQNDHFNGKVEQYPRFKLALSSSDPAVALQEMETMMDAITDQGEGSVLERDPHLLQAVQPMYRASLDAMKQLYPSFDDSGAPLPDSADANARHDSDGDDHYERLQAIQKLLPDVATWATAGKTGKWTASDYEAPDYDGSNPHNLPEPADLANAMNAIADEGCLDTNYVLLSQAVVGTIAGVTTVLNDYWSKPKVTFPGPAMGGTGDRMAIAWAAMGRCPDLSLGLDPLPDGVLHHACQGLDYLTDGNNSCAPVGVFHSCIGSNACHAQGGCGFVQSVEGGGSCSSSPVPKGDSPSGGRASPLLCGAPKPSGCGAPKPGGGCGAPTVYSAPGDNKCQSFGGCAVPISASQLYPALKDGSTEGAMQVFDFVMKGGAWTSEPIDRILFKEGDKVDDIAFQAFDLVMKHRGKPAPARPAPSLVRLVFPPST